jgi:hypothetical protein
MMNDMKVKNCYSCSKYFKCPDKKYKWWPCTSEMSCWKPIKIDKKG